MHFQLIRILVGQSNYQLLLLSLVQTEVLNPILRGRGRPKLNSSPKAFQAEHFKPQSCFYCKCVHKREYAVHTPDHRTLIFIEYQNVRLGRQSSRAKTTAHKQGQKQTVFQGIIYAMIQRGAAHKRGSSCSGRQRSSGLLTVQ